MPTLFLRLPHYVASYLQTIEADRLRAEGHDPNQRTSTSLEAPLVIPIAVSDPLYAEVSLRSCPNRTNEVNPRCFSLTQWRLMLKGHPLRYNDFPVAIQRKYTCPISSSEVEHLCPPVQPASISSKADPTQYPSTRSREDDPTQYPSTRSKEETSPYTYVEFRLPDIITRHDPQTHQQREFRVYSDWWLPRPELAIKQLVSRFRRELVQFVSTDLEYCRSAGLDRAKSESVQLFCERYNIRDGEREREQLKKFLYRATQAAYFHLESNSDHQRLITERYQHDPSIWPRYGHPVHCIDDNTDYPSIAQCARHYGIRPHNLSVGLSSSTKPRHECKIHGIRFCEVRPPSTPTIDD